MIQMLKRRELSLRLRRQLRSELKSRQDSNTASLILESIGHVWQFLNGTTALQCAFNYSLRSTLLLVCIHHRRERCTSIKRNKGMAGKWVRSIA